MVWTLHSIRPPTNTHCGSASVSGWVGYHRLWRGCHGGVPRTQELRLRPPTHPPSRPPGPPLSENPVLWEFFLIEDHPSSFKNSRAMKGYFRGPFLLFLKIPCYESYLLGTFPPLFKNPCYESYLLGTFPPLFKNPVLWRLSHGYIGSWLSLGDFLSSLWKSRAMKAYFGGGSSLLFLKILCYERLSVGAPKQ